MVVLGLLPCGHADDANDVLTDDHASAADDEDLAAAEALDGPEREWGRADVDECSDEGDEEGIADCPKGGEEDSTEVEDEVDARQLLHHLHKNT